MDTESHHINKQPHQQQQQQQQQQHRLNGQEGKRREAEGAELKELKYLDSQKKSLPPSAANSVGRLSGESWGGCVGSHKT
jgi:hypothetical protein